MLKKNYLHAVNVFLKFSWVSKPLENEDYESEVKRPLQSQIMRITSKKTRKFGQNHQAKGIMRTFSMYITQIKPLENGDCESVLKRPLQPQIMRVTSQKNQKFGQNHY